MFEWNFRLEWVLQTVTHNFDYVRKVTALSACSDSTVEHSNCDFLSDQVFWACAPSSLSLCFHCLPQKVLTYGKCALVPLWALKTVNSEWWVTVWRTHSRRKFHSNMYFTADTHSFFSGKWLPRRSVSWCVTTTLSCLASVTALIHWYWPGSSMRCSSPPGSSIRVISARGIFPTPLSTRCSRPACVRVVRIWKEFQVCLVKWGPLNFRTHQVVGE